MDPESIYNEYLTRLKPLIAELEGRTEHFEESLLENMTAMFDYISMAICESELQQKNDYLIKAHEKLELSIKQSYRCLIATIWNGAIKPFEHRIPSKTRDALDNGHFIGAYDGLRKDVVNLKNLIDKNNSVTPLEDYKKCYDNLIKMEKMILKQRLDPLFINSSSCGWVKSSISIILNISATVLVAWLFRRFF